MYYCWFLDCGEFTNVFRYLLSVPFSSIFIIGVSRSCIKSFFVRSLRTYWGLFARLEWLVSAEGSVRVSSSIRFPPVVQNLLLSRSVGPMWALQMSASSGGPIERRGVFVSSGVLCWLLEKASKSTE